MGSLFNCVQKSSKTRFRAEIYTQSYKNIGQKIPPPKFLHFYAKIVKILAYMQNKCIFSRGLCMKKQEYFRFLQVIALVQLFDFGGQKVCKKRGFCAIIFSSSF